MRLGYIFSVFNRQSYFRPPNGCQQYFTTGTYFDQLFESGNLRYAQNLAEWKTMVLKTTSYRNWNFCKMPQIAEKENNKQKLQIAS